MGGKVKKIILVAALLATLQTLLSAQQKEQKDSLVRLVKARSLELIEKNGQKFRKSVDATFLHNGTYLICDTALWNMDTKVINAEGNVRMVQDETILTSDKLDYYIDDNLVQFRGSVVQLEDAEHNTLRTRYLDYNTKDSVAVFMHGGSMRDKEGQIIESIDGSYDARAKLFKFQNNVNMFTDSVFIKTSLLDYESGYSRANFLADIDFWKDGKMLSASRGWYERPVETFFFTGKVHINTEEQEGWSDTLYYYRTPNDVLMLGHAQVQDSTHDVAALAGRIYYTDSLAKVKLSREAAIALITKEEEMLRDSAGRQIGKRERKDTLYFGADTLIYRTIPRCEIPENELVEASQRLSDILTDPVAEFRQKAAKEAAEKKKAAEAEAARQKGLPGAGGKGSAKLPPKDGKPAGTPYETAVPADTPTPLPDTLQVPPDSLIAPADTLIAPADTIAAPKDSTKIGFMEGKGRVKVYRHDIQIVCDSLRYNDLDSIARFYIDPIVWNDGNRQYTSDSLFALIRNNAVDKVSLQSNAFILTQEDTLLWDQIKATEVMAYFDDRRALRRFDALGGASAIFYLKEKEQFATVNKVETKMLSAWFKNGEMDRVYYFDSPKNDAYPLPQLRSDEKRLRGFAWMPEKQPRGKNDITSLVLKPSERSAYDAHPRTTFTQTDIYFPGYMKSVYQGLDAAKRRRAEAGRVRGAVADSSAVAAEGIAPADSAAKFLSIQEEPALVDSLAPADSLTADSLALAVSLQGLLVDPAPPTPAEIRAQKRRARIDAREARWAELDRRDAEKAAAKKAQAEAKAKARLEKQLKRQQEQEIGDKKKLDKYVERYRRQKARKEAKAAQKTAKQKNDKTKDNGTDTGQISPLREGGHPEQ